jgi:predicted nucleic acid-binding protein
MAGPPEVVVADASVVAKWFSKEDYTEDALRLRQDYRDRKVDIRAPSLLPFEVLNALLHKPDFGLEDLKTAAEALGKYALQLVALHGELSTETVERAVALGLTMYDASYVALALQEGCALYTADEKLAAKARALPAVHHISDYESP